MKKKREMAWVTVIELLLEIRSKSCVPRGISKFTKGDLSNHSCLDWQEHAWVMLLEYLMWHTLAVTRFRNGTELRPDRVCSDGLDAETVDELTPASILVAGYLIFNLAADVRGSQLYIFSSRCKYGPVSLLFFTSYALVQHVVVINWMRYCATYATECKPC